MSLPSVLSASVLAMSMSISSLWASEALKWDLREGDAAEIASYTQQVISWTEDERKETVALLSELSVDELCKENPGIHPTPGSKLVRRSLQEYEDHLLALSFEREENGEALSSLPRTLVLFSGHEGGHQGVFGSTQSSANYMVDLCWDECAPDYVMDVKNPLHWQHFPSQWADLIVADDARFLGDEVIAQALRVLKSEGRLAFQAGGGLGWPTAARSLDNGFDFAISANGRAAQMDPKHALAFRAKDSALQKEFLEKAIGQAQRYYAPMGIARVTFESNCFVLHKK